MCARKFLWRIFFFVIRLPPAMGITPLYKKKTVVDETELFRSVNQTKWSLILVVVFLQWEDARELHYRFPYHSGTHELHYVKISFLNINTKLDPCNCNQAHAQNFFKGVRATYLPVGE